jgi:hypothetical protein
MGMLFEKQPIKLPPIAVLAKRSKCSMAAQNLCDSLFHYSAIQVKSNIQIHIKSFPSCVALSIIFCVPQSIFNASLEFESIIDNLELSNDTVFYVI